MAKSLFYCLFIPVPLLAALCSDTGIGSKFVCIGDSVEVFQNITSSSYKGVITLYKTFSGSEDTIAEWSMQNISDTDIHDKYKQKVALENGTIWIRDFQASDEATYIMLYDINLSKRKEMQLCGLEYCGKPSVSVQWMKYPDIFYVSKTVIELPPGTEARTYTACVEGEVLKCMKDSTEWSNCENFTVKSIRGNDSPTTSSDIPQINRTSIVTVVIVLLVLLIVSVILHILWRRFGLVPKRLKREHVEIPMGDLRLLPE